MPGPAVNKAVDGALPPPDAPTAPVRIGLRRTVVIGVIGLVVIAIVSIFADWGGAIVGEYRFSRALQASPQVTFDPEVTLGGFPYVSHAASGRFSSAVITARGVSVNGCPADAPCRAELGATLGAFTVDNGWHIRPDDTLAVESVEAYTRLDSVNLGRMLGIIDLTVNTPAPSDKAGGGGPQDGLLRRTTGVLLTGTVPLPDEVTSDGDTATYRHHSDLPPSASAYPGPKVKVSVNVDLSVVDGRLRLSATGFYTGPEEHVDAEVPTESRRAVLARFSRTLPVLPMPWDIAATRAYSEGSDVLIAAHSGPREVRPEQF